MVDIKPLPEYLLVTAVWVKVVKTQLALTIEVGNVQGYCSRAVEGDGLVQY